MRTESLRGALLAAAALVGAAPAHADQATNWNCRASALALSGAKPEPRFEPLVANGNGDTGADRPACAEDRGGAPELSTAPDAQTKVRVQGPFAATSVRPAIAAARDQFVYAGTKAADVSVATPGNQLVVTAQAIRAEAGARCVNGAPAFDGSSTVIDLRVNGQPLPVNDAVVSQITQAISDSPLGGVVKVRVNQRVQTPEGLTVQAVRVELFSAAGSPQGVVVLGEAKVSRRGDTCAPAGPTPANPGTSGGDGTPGGGGTDGSSTAAPESSTEGASTTVVKKVMLNGRNGGCGRIRVWFEKVDLLHRLPGRPRRATSRFGDRVLVRGRLISCSGKPIVGARLTQVHRVGGGVGRLLKTGVKTRSLGRFTYIEPLNLTTRRIVFLYRGNLASRKVTSRKVLRLTVRNRHGKVLRGRPPRTLE